MNGWLLWIVDCYSNFFYTTFVVGVFMVLVSLLFFVNDVVENHIGLETPWESRDLCNKISIILSILGVIAMLVAVLTPSRDAFIHMMNIDPDQLCQIYGTTRHFCR